MPDYALLFVPTDPYWQPTKEAANEAVTLFWTIAPKANEIEASFSDAVEFYHPFGNWDGVRCPKCAADLEDWFFVEVEQAYARDRFAELTRSTPCCDLTVSLNDLDFGWPAAFGRFALEAMNPAVLTTDEQERNVANVLGSKLKKIWRRI